eukprot:560006-Rhodomonas_salina.1
MTRHVFTLQCWPDLRLSDTAVQRLGRCQPLKNTHKTQCVRRCQRVPLAAHPAPRTHFLSAAEGVKGVLSGAFDSADSRRWGPGCAGAALT